MRYFFIDLENVRSEGLEGVLSLGSDDMVFIYYSDNAMNLSIPTLENLNNSKASKKFIKTNYIGKNAMDFQIVSLFGAMIERNRHGSYYIISQDNGFRSAVSFCESYFESYGIFCGVYPTIISAITDELKKNVNRGKQEEASKKAGKSKKTEETKKQAEPAKKIEETKKQAEPAKKAEETKKQAEPAKKTEEAKKQKKATKKDEDTNVQKEQPESAEASATNETVENAQSESGSAEKTAKKKRRRKKKAKNPQNTEATSTSDGTSAESGDDPDTETDAEASGEEDSATESVTEKKQIATKAEAEKPVNKLGYIYDILSELLSEKTIDIYAAAIDEGIAKCKNRDELHEYFRERFGEDEGEALYRVTQGDFEKMKQLRPKRPSRSRHKNKGKH